MTIRIIDDKPRVHKCGSKYWHVRGEGEMVLAGCDTLEEAEQAKRAFENVLLPRFTRDEAIAIAKTAIDAYYRTGPDGWPEIAATARVVLEALAAAGVFVDRDVTIRDQSGNGNDLSAPTMAELLDAAGIR